MCLFFPRAEQDTMSFGCRRVLATHCCRRSQPLGLWRHAPRKMPPFLPNNAPEPTASPYLGGYRSVICSGISVDENGSSDCRCVLGLLPLLLKLICSGTNASITRVMMGVLGNTTAYFKQCLFIHRQDLGVSVHFLYEYVWKGMCKKKFARHPRIKKNSSPRR